jgi:hypothetical protein
MSPAGIAMAVAAFARRFRRIPVPAIGLAGIGTLVILNLFPASQPFEGVLEAISVTFKTADGGDVTGRTFLATQVSSISLGALDVDSVGLAFPVQLGGDIRSAFQMGVALPKLEARPILPIRLSHGDNLSLGAPSRSTTAIVAKLVLPPGTKVKDLTYDEHTSTLGFGIVPPSGGEKPALTITPQEPLQVEIPASALTGIPLPSSGEVSFRLDTSEFSVPIKAPARLLLKLATPPGIDLFPQRLKVSEVSFEKEPRSSSDEVPIPRSTLKGGTLHLGQQEMLTLRPDQSLIIKPPGIDELNFLRVTLPQKGESPSAKPGQSSPEGPVRLTAGVVGTSYRIAAGLSQSHPTSYREGSLLSRLLNPSQLTAVNGFLGGIASALVLSFFKEEKEKNPDRKRTWIQR